jgi:hypothetical protein
MKIDAGALVWINCEVQPGAFPDERQVRLASSLADWVGFVPVLYLKDPILHGETKIRVRIVEVQNDRFSARIPGEAFGNTLYGDLISKVDSLGFVPT